MKCKRGIFTSLEASQLKAVRNKYKTLWDPTDDYMEIKVIASPQVLLNEAMFNELCTAFSFVDAAKSYRRSTAQSYDGFHCTHWGMLGSMGSELVSKFCCLCLALGTMPSQLSPTLAVFLPKATMGLRSIGLFPSLYRVVTKQQQPRLRAWEDLNPPSCVLFSGGAERPPQGMGTGSTG